MSNAAAAGRLVVILLFVANVLVYFVKASWYGAGGMLLSIAAAGAGYFAASFDEYDLETESQRILVFSMMACVASGMCFALGAI